MAAAEGAARNVRIVLAYEGTDFHGWQRQPGTPTVQAAVENKLARVAGHPVQVIAAGRTDAGVHATGQVVNFRTTGRIPTERIAMAMNSLPPHSVVGRHVREVPGEFHARFDAVRRTYRYYLLRSGPSPFLRRYTCPARQLTDVGIARMEAALPQLVGEHDFSSFCATGSELRGRMRRVERAELRARGPLVMLTFAANAFLQGMVRAMVGTLLEIAAGTRPVDDVPRVLAARDRRAAGEAAPPQGLFLVKVDYGREDREGRQECLPHGEGE